MFCSSPARYQHASSVVLSRCRAACTPARTWQGRCRVAACATFTQARLARRPYCLLERERGEERERERERERRERERREREKESERGKEKEREKEKKRESLHLHVCLPTHPAHAVSYGA
jgi:hypothetical protein